MNRQKVIKYLTRLKYRELKNKSYWESDAPFLDNCINVLKNRERRDTKC